MICERLREAIACYDEDRDEKIVKVCQLAKVDEFISQLPDKYQTVLGEFGANLSGGQRQRLAFPELNSIALLDSVNVWLN